jgi:hypothetical protein
LWGLHEGRQKLRRNEPRAHGSNGGGAEDGDCGVGKRRDLGEVKERRAGGLMNYAIRQVCDAESRMTCVERNGECALVFKERAVRFSWLARIATFFPMS